MQYYQLKSHTVTHPVESIEKGGELRLEWMEQLLVSVGLSVHTGQDQL